MASWPQGWGEESPDSRSVEDPVKAGDLNRKEQGQLEQQRRILSEGDLQTGVKRRWRTRNDAEALSRQTLRGQSSSLQPTNFTILHTLANGDNDVGTR